MKIAKVLVWLAFLVSVSSESIVSVSAQGKTFASDQNVDVSPDEIFYWGPETVQSGNTIQVEWAADREMTVAILNEIDWNNFQQRGFFEPLQSSLGIWSFWFYRVCC